MHLILRRQRKTETVAPCLFDLHGTPFSHSQSSCRVNLIWCSVRLRPPNGSCSRPCNRTDAWSENHKPPTDSATVFTLQVDRRSARASLARRVMSFDVSCGRPLLVFHQRGGSRTTYLCTTGESSPPSTYWNSLANIL